MTKNIGITTPKPETECTDKKCPFHGSIGVRGKTFTGKIISTKLLRTATIQKEWQYYIPKYQRYAKKRSNLMVHNPICIGATEGDIVRVAETRPLSKTKHFVVIEKLKSEEIKTAVMDEPKEKKKSPKKRKKQKIILKNQNETSKEKNKCRIAVRIACSSM